MIHFHWIFLKTLSIHSTYSYELSMILTLTMAIPIKLFQFTQKLYSSVGIYPPVASKNHLFNSKNGFIIFSWGHLSIFIGVFFLFKAESLYEYGCSYHICLTTLAAIFYFLTNIYQMENILKLIEKFDEFIACSELKFTNEILLFEFRNVKSS